MIIVALNEKVKLFKAKPIKKLNLIFKIHNIVIHNYINKSMIILSEQIIYFNILVI